jgi:predicted metal-binding membrane protein
VKNGLTGINSAIRARYTTGCGGGVGGSCGVYPSLSGGGGCCWVVVVLLVVVVSVVVVLVLVVVVLVVVEKGGRCLFRCNYD